jgi:hypothetical protein
MEFTNTASDCGQGETGRFRHGGEPTPLQLQSFGGRPIPTQTLVHTWAEGLVFPSKAFYDHRISHIESRTTRVKFVK